jgi:hypothetical protein
MQDGPYANTNNTHVTLAPMQIQITHMRYEPYTITNNTNAT